jgi:hypothetical protein
MMKIELPMMTTCTVWTILLQSEEEYDDRAGEGPINIDGYNGDGQSVYSSSDAGEGDEVSSVIDLDPELQAIKAKISFYSIQSLTRQNSCVYSR